MQIYKYALLTFFLKLRKFQAAKLVSLLMLIMIAPLSIYTEEEQLSLIHYL